MGNKKNVVLHVLVTLMIAALLLGACAPTPTPAPAEPTSAPAASEPTKAEEPTAAPTVEPTKPPMDKVTLRLSWRWKTEFAALVLADDKGFFEEQNIDVELLEGKGSGDVVPLIAQKEDDFGYLNLTTVTIGISKGMPIKVVAGLMGKHPSGLAYFEDKPVKEPKDLEGKTIALAPGEAFAVIYPAFATKWGIDTSKVKTVNLDPSVKNQAFLEGDIDVLPLYINNELPILRTKTDKKIDVLMPADWGFNTIANGIITHQDTIDKNPDLVRRFVAAVVKGYQYSLEHPEEAVEAVKARSQELAGQPQEVLLEQVKLTLDLIHSEATVGKPIGWMAEEDWNRTLDLLYETGGIEKRPENSTVFTNDFIPTE
ncbi:MAG: ABC transporter substrate-binding protein [Anaerolineae bacterium]|nr:ABC transporter substrate-binding protein [Anaerolineae bacterium]